MKILLYSGNQRLIAKSGIGRALSHQMRALEKNNIEYTTDPTEPYDIIHINTIFPESLKMSLKAKAAGKKIVYHAHSTEADFRNSFVGSNLVSPFFKLWIKKCYTSGDVILTPTKYSKQYLMAYGMDKKILSISNGIDLNQFQKLKGEREPFRAKYGLDKDAKVIISVGLQIERKGILDFVEIAKKMPEYNFFWFGYTDPRFIPKKIKDAIKTKLPNLFFPGYVEPVELIKAYSAGDLFLFMTHEETEGIVLLEALAMKLKTLVRDIPVYKDWLIEGKNIWKGRSIEDFQEKIKKIMENQLPDLTEEGYKVVKEKELSIVGQELKIVYENLMHSAKNKRQ